MAGLTALDARCERKETSDKWQRQAHRGGIAAAPIGTY
jgi:hypothetical protein